MPIFTRQLRKMDTSTPEQAVREMANHIRYIQEQLEWTLSNLDSSNINEINMSQTNVTSSGAANIGGDGISIKGKNGEIFEVGIGDSGTFVFTLKGKDGKQMAYVDNEGKLIVTRNAYITIDDNTDFTIDGGTW